jgi:hypothetical protein
MKVKFTLKEQCTWSLREGQTPYRYVHIDLEGGSPAEYLRHQIIELPEQVALGLCAALGSSESQSAQLQVAMHPNGWFPARLLPAATSLVRRLGAKATAWLGQTSMKYMHIRVDLRSGDFCFTDNEGHDAGEQLFKMIDLHLLEKPENEQ